MHVADESVDLIYLDPPFNSDQTYNVLFQEHDGSTRLPKFRRSLTPGIGTAKQWQPTKRLSKPAAKRPTLWWVFSMSWAAAT